MLVGVFLCWELVRKYCVRDSAMSWLLLVVASIDASIVASIDASCC